MSLWIKNKKSKWHWKYPYRTVDIDAIIINTEIIGFPFVPNFMHDTFNHTRHLLARATTFFRFGSGFLVFETERAILLACFYLCLLADTVWRFTAFDRCAVVGTRGPLLTDIVDFTVVFARFSFYLTATLVVHRFDDELVVVVIGVYFNWRTLSFGTGSLIVTWNCRQTFSLFTFARQAKAENNRKTLIVILMAFSQRRYLWSSPWLILEWFWTIWGYLDSLALGNII